MSPTSQPKKSKATPKDSIATTPEDKLQMVQAALNLIETLPGCSVQQTNIYDQGQQAAGIILIGCAWDDAGNLVLAIKEKEGE